MSRLAAELDELARIGADDGGVTRTAWSAELLRAHEWLAGKLQELGLSVETDAAGNVVGRWESGSGKAVAVGSHLDTVPRGGRFDGALGVLAGLEAIRLLRERGVTPSCPVWLVSFNDEEGTRFGTGLLGSRAFAGEDLAGLAERRDSQGLTLREAMALAGFDFDRLPDARRVEELRAYLELHIEQGPVLERAGLDVGVVSSIVGLLGFRVRFFGEANHAGTTPMELRRDAAVGLARAVLELRREALACAGMTANVGFVKAEPGGLNVVPGAAELTIDVRHASREGFSRLEPFVRETLERIAAEERLEVELRELFRLEPVELDPGLVGKLERAAELEGARWTWMASGAGHDAMVIGRYVPAAMLFVPSRGGVSHSPDEHTAPEHCELGARVLARALELILAESSGEPS